MIRFLHEKEEPSKICPSPKVWLRSSVVSSARLVFGRRGFQVYTRIVALHNFHPQVK